MSFVNKFKQANPSNSPRPNGIKLEATSFGQPAPAYSQPQIQNQTSVPKKGKPRGGWDDEDDEITLANLQKSNTFSMTSGNNAPVVKPSLVISTGNHSGAKSVQVTQPTQQQELYQRFSVVLMNEEFEQTHEYEIKIINDLIQPGGARLKQPDAVLSEFCRASDSLQVEVVGSILLHNITAQIVWISKARAIYAIEVLVKNFMKYYDYFRYNIKQLRRIEFEDEGINAPQLAKIIDDVIDHLEDPEKASSVKQRDPTASSQPNSSASPEEAPLKIYSQSAVYSTQPTGLTSQLVSESSTEASPTKDLDSAPIKPSNSSSSFLSKFKAKAQTQTSPEQNKMENIMESLAELNFDEVKPQKEEEVKPQPAKNFDDVYNMYLNSNPHNGFAQPQMHHQNGFNQRAYNNGYGQYNQYPQYNPQMSNAYHNHYNGQFAGQNASQFYPMQGAHGVSGMNAGPTLSAEEYLKSKKHEENEKRFANLKFGF